MWGVSEVRSEGKWNNGSTLEGSKVDGQAAPCTPVLFLGWQVWNGVGPVLFDLEGTASCF